MKNIYSILLWMLACAPVAVHAGNETSYLPAVGISQQGVVKKDRTVQLSMTVDLSRLRMNTQHTVALTPVLVSADGRREVAFPPVVIDGKTRNKMYLRAQRLESVELPPYHDGSEQVVIRRRNGKEQQYNYVAAVPYERWMLDGRVEVREAVHGCANCGRGTSEQLLVEKALPTYIPAYRLDEIAPEPEPVKARAETRTARLQFRQDSYNILPKFKNNQAELDTVSHSIRVARNNADLSITGIFITGYASPEGSVAHNLKLSENRAKALADYIRRHDAMAADMLHVDWKGEDWVGFRQVLADFPGLLRRDEVYRIIDECEGDRDLCEKQLRELVPATIYQRLLNEVYPLLRRNEYRIEYNVRNFDLEEARRMLRERPDLLSLTEIYKVAASYQKGSDDYNRAMRAAERYFSHSPAVLNRLAVEAMERGEHVRAVELLQRADATVGNGPLQNTLGVALSKAGRLREAQEAFRRAAELGSAHARHNQAEVDAVIDQL